MDSGWIKLGAHRHENALFPDKHALLANLEDSDPVFAYFAFECRVSQQSGAFAGSIIGIDERVEMNRHHALGSE